MWGNATWILWLWKLWGQVWVSLPIIHDSNVNNVHVLIVPKKDMKLLRKLVEENILRSMKVLTRPIMKELLSKYSNQVRYSQ